MIKTVKSLLLVLCLPVHLAAQSDALPRADPLEMETWLYNGTYVKITYTKAPLHSNLPEMGALWQLGTNEPAELMTTGDLLIEKDTLKAGAYSIFAIPADTTWTIIFNSDVGLFDSYRYNESADVFRLEVKVEDEEYFNERLKILFSRKGVPESELSIFWKQKSLSIPVEILKTEDN